MPSVYAYSNEDIDFYLLGATVTASPSTYGFDSLVKTALYIQNTNAEAWRIYLTDQNWGGAARSSLRFQFRMYTEGGTASLSFGNGPSGRWIGFWDIAAGRELFRISNGNGSNFVSDCQLQYWTGSAWVTVGTATTVPGGISTHTVTIIMGGSGTGKILWHMNGMLVATYTGNTIFTASTNISMISGHCWGGSGASGKFTNVFAEFILCTEDYMPFGLRVWNPRITGAGANSGQVSGVYTDINENALVTATGITFDTAGQLATFAMEDVPAALTSSPFMSARVAINARRGASGPQTLEPVLQQTAGLQVPAAPISLDGIGFTTVASQFLLDYAGNPFTPTVLNASEPGGRAAA